jgi:hypothetical protein
LKGETILRISQHTDYRSLHCFKKVAKRPTPDILVAVLIPPLPLKDHAAMLAKRSIPRLRHGRDTATASSGTMTAIIRKVVRGHAPKGS